MKQRLKINQWVNFEDRLNYVIPRSGIPGIYYFRNTVDGKGYIGMTSNLHRRIVGHMTMLRKKNSYAEVENQPRAILNFYKQMWQFELSDIEFCILYMIEDESLTEEQIKEILSPKLKEFIQEYDTIANGYNSISENTINATRKYSEETREKMKIANKQKANNGDNTVYVYDITTKERLYCLTMPALCKYIGTKIDPRQLKQNSVIKKNWLGARSVEELEDKIEYYYKHCDLTGTYRADSLIPEEMVRDLFKGITYPEFSAKYNLKDFAYKMYQKQFETNCKVNRLNYEFFMYRREHSLEDTQRHLGMSYVAAQEQERFNNKNLLELNDMYIDGNYPYNYYIINNFLRGTIEDYKFIDVE